MALNGLFCADVPLRNYSLTELIWGFRHILYCKQLVIYDWLIDWLIYRQAAGKYKQKGRDYVVEDGDIIHFKFNAGAGLQQAKKK